MEELIDEVNLQGIVIATHPKSHFKERMFLHKAALIIPKAKNGKFLFCKRAKNKHPFPGTWCCAVGGKVSSNETEENAAIREMKEEIGQIYPLKKVISFIYNEDDYKALFTIFTTTEPVSEKELKLDEEEIEYVKAFTIKEILEMLEKQPSQFAPTFILAIKEFEKYYK